MHYCTGDRTLNRFTETHFKTDDLDIKTQMLSVALGAVPAHSMG